MTQDEIIEMARQAGLRTHIPFWMDTEVAVALKAFAKLVADAAAAKEREACAKLCEYLGQPHEMQSMAESIWTEISAKNFADAIRTRGETTLRGETI